MESVVERYRNPNQPLSDYARVVEAHTRTRIEQLNHRLDEIHEEKDQLKEREKQLNEIEKTRVKGWWEQPVENLNKEQVKEWKAFFQDFSTKVKNRIEELKNGASSSSTATTFQSGNAVAPPPGVGASSFTPSPFHDQYYNVPPTFPLGRSDQMMPEQFYVPQPAAQDPSSSVGGSGGGGGHQYSVLQYNFDHLPPPQTGQDPSGPSGSGSGQFPIQYGYGYFPPVPGMDPSSSAGGASFDNLIQYNYMAPPQGYDPSSSSGGVNQAGPSHQGNADQY